MSSIIRIESNYNTFTETEKKIAEYILENRDAMINESAQIVAQNTKTSPSTVVRFARRLGYTGFTDLKLNIAGDAKLPHIESIDSIIKEQDSYETMMYKAEHANKQTFLKTYQLINLTTLEKAIKTLNQARRIYLLGIGGSSIVALDLHHKLLRIDIESIYMDDFHMFLTATTHITHEDVLLSFTYSGNTYESVIAQKYAKASGATTIAITANVKGEIVKHSQHTLFIPQEEKEIRLGSIASRFSFFAISDLLYYGIAKNNLNTITEKLTETRKLLNVLKQRK